MRLCFADDTDEKWKILDCCYKESFRKAKSWSVVVRSGVQLQMTAMHNFCIFCSISCIWLSHTANLNPEYPHEINCGTITGVSVTVFHQMPQECQVLLNHINLFRLSVNAPSHSN